jgi:hypothetical protein
MTCKIFEIEVSEQLSRTVLVAADNIENALELVQDMYRREEIVLDAGDYRSTRFCACVNEVDSTAD